MADMNSQVVVSAIVLVVAVSVVADYMSSSVQLEDHISTRQPLAVANDGRMLEAALKYDTGSVETALSAGGAQTWTQGDGTAVTVTRSGSQLIVTSGTQAPFTVQLVAKALPPGTVTQAR